MFDDIIDLRIGEVSRSQPPSSLTSTLCDSLTNKYPLYNIKTPENSALVANLSSINLDYFCVTVLWFL